MSEGLHDRYRRCQYLVVVAAVWHSPGECMQYLSRPLQRRAGGREPGKFAVSYKTPLTEEKYLFSTGREITSTLQDAR